MAAVGYATLIYLSSLTIVLFVYTFLWDFYVGFWNMALGYGANTTFLGYLYTIHQYLPIIFFVGETIAYIATVERRPIR